ncbi:MAG: class I SAM-dependent methyltransferase [Spirochaetes bacterium]|nr:class I SAM-dependent methyltransferase [Spirochaetota bacterium]
MERAYSHIPIYYDYLLRHVDYERWYQYIRDVMFRYLRDPQTVLEIGCGTGKFGAKFSRDDFTIYGMDNSLEMLKVAKARAKRNFSIFCADVRNFALSKNIDFIFAVHDTMNYLVSTEEMRLALCAVERIMHAKSIFMFDLTTEHNIRKFFDGKITRCVRGRAEVIWENSYNPYSKIVTSILTVVEEGKIHQEEHRQRIYEKEEIIPVLNESGLEIIDVFGDYTFDEPSDTTVMVNYIVKKRL